MAKIYKGWELMQAMAEGEIKEGSKFVDKLYKEEYIYSRNEITNEPLLYKKDTVTEDYFIPDYSFFAEKDNDFELIEDEIDIDSIEELNNTCYDVNTMSDDDLEFYHNKTRTTINEIVQAVKQIDKRVKKLED